MVINDTFFVNLNNNSAYVLGLLFSDGYMYKEGSKHRVSLTLKSEDGYLVKQVAKMMDAEKYVYEAVYSGLGRCTLNMNSKVMYNTLLWLGMTPRKSLTIEYPNIDSILNKYFIRGYFDGNGCFTSRYNYRVDGTPKLWGRASIQCGSLSFIERVAQILKEEVNVDSVLDVKRTCKDLRFRVEGYKRLFDYLYSDTNLFLIRKKIKFEEFLKTR